MQSGPLCVGTGEKEPGAENIIRERARGWLGQAGMHQGQARAGRERAPSRGAHKSHASLHIPNKIIQALASGGSGNGGEDGELGTYGGDHRQRLHLQQSGGLGKGESAKKGEQRWWAVGVHHNICGQVMWSRVPSRAVPLSITYFHLSKGLQFSAGMDNQLRIGVAGLRSLRLPNRRWRRTNRWSSCGHARGAWHQAPPSCSRPLAVMVGLRSPLCWSRDSKALSVFHP